MIEKYEGSVTEIRDQIQDYLKVNTHVRVKHLEMADTLDVAGDHLLACLVVYEYIPVA